MEIESLDDVLTDIMVKFEKEAYLEAVKAFHHLPHGEFQLKANEYVIAKRFFHSHLN